MNKYMKLRFLGACNEVGRSGLLIETDKKIISDYGIKIKREKTDEYMPLKPPKDTNLLIVNHAHLDHSGGMPYAYENCKKPVIIGTSATRDLTKLLLKDNIKIVGRDNLPYSINSYKNMINKFYTTVYDRTMQFGKTNVTLVDAGHITGSAMSKIEYGNKTLLYTSDFNTCNTQLHKGTKFKEKVDYLIMESTYGNRNHPDRRKTELEFNESIKRVIDKGGNVLVPAFAVDRSQEIISVIRSFNKDVDIYLDGMSIEASEIMLNNPDYVSNVRKFRRALETVNFVTSNRDREKAVSYPCVIVSTSGMLSGGPVMGYLHSLHPNSSLFFTGFCVEETNGWYLRNKGYIMHEGIPLKIDLPWKYFDFSAHPDQRSMLEFIKKVSPEKVFTMHGDDTKGFA